MKQKNVALLRKILRKKYDETAVDESTLSKQVTRTSVESQPRSMKNCMNQTEI